MKQHPWRGYFLIAGATFCWAAAATVGKAVFNGSLFQDHTRISPLVLTQCRTTFSLLVLSVIVRVRYGRQFFKINFRALGWCVLAGTMGIAGSNFFYYFAIDRATVAIAITIQYAAPVWVLLYMVLSGREGAAWGRVASVGLAMVGIALAIGVVPSGLSFTVVGAGAALMASFSFAFYTVLAASLVRRHHPLRVMMYTLLGAATLWNLLNPPWRLAAQNYNGTQWGFLFVFACLSMALPYVFYFSGLKYLNPTQAVIASCLEPVFAIVFAALFIHERLRGLQLLGILAVLAASVMAQLGEGRQASRNQDGLQESGNAVQWDL